MYNNFVGNPQFDPYARLQLLEQQQANYNQMQQQQAQQQVVRKVDFVGGYDGAKTFQMPNNSSSILMDNSEPIFYMVSTDNAGMRDIKAFKFEAIDITPKAQQPLDTSNFVTKEDLEKIIEQINDLKGCVLNG